MIWGCLNKFFIKNKDVFGMPPPVELSPLNIIDQRGELPVHETKTYSKRTKPFTHVAIHHSLTDTGTAEIFARYHINDKGWPGIGYPYVIHKDGTIEWCWDLNLRTYHVGNSNNFALGIVNVGDYNSSHPTNIQWETCLRLVEKVAPHVPVVNVWGHQEYDDYSWKKCPGTHWVMAQFRKELMQVRNGKHNFHGLREHGE